MFAKKEREENVLFDKLLKAEKFISKSSRQLCMSAPSFCRQVAARGQDMFLNFYLIKIHKR
jgi:hypothetical protein